MVTATPRPLRVADRLKEARERRGLSQRQIAEVTKLSPQVLRALEDDKVTLLPSGIYRRSLVRAVAREVGLDPETELLAFLVEHPDDMPLPGEQPAIEPPVSRGSSWRRLLAVLGAIIPILAGVAYFAGVPRWLNADVPPPVIERTPPVDAHEIVAVGGIQGDVVRRGRSVDVLITVSARCVLQVVADGREMMGRAMEAGERLHLELGESLELLGDNAGAVQFSINGQAGRRLGSAGEPLSVRIDRSDYELFLASY